MKMKPALTRSLTNLSGAVLALSILLMGGVAYMAIAQPQGEEKREMLAKHETVAQFTGISYHRCMGMTTLCPDKCGHSGDMATFRIIKYLAYEKTGKYGEEQEKQFQILIQDNMKNLKVPADIKAAVDGLKPGDYVLLNWQHDYVSKAGANYPERNITRLTSITKDEAEKLAGSLDQPDKEKP